MKFKPDFALRSEKQLISYFIKYEFLKMKMKLILLKKKIIHFLMNTSQKNIKQFGPELDDLYDYADCFKI